MTGIVDRWLGRELSQISQLSHSQADADALTYEKERRNPNSLRSELRMQIRDSATAKPAKPAKVVPWTEMPDVIAVVEDLADEKNSVRKISRLLGLSRTEIVTILRRTGR
jgi:hypothetical protein